ncbi:hypothetical protein ACO03V_13100 [Microbacterium sp. HMH0099]|uniref:hypothetical protein n=1 Tax=Microbacterium sp. HMH0099 TaxID=3414026 RepID=UPI003BF6E1CB
MTTALTGVAAAAPAGAPAATRGRIDVADRVYRKAAEQAAAEAIGIDRSDVSIDITGSRDTVVVRVNAPFPIPRLDDTPAITTTVPVLEAARGIQADLHTRLTRLFGRDVSRVDLTLTGATTPKRKRVR